MTEQRPRLRQVVMSVLAAFIGVQSEKNRRRDFTHGRPAHYIVVGLAMTVLFVLLLYGVVQLVLRAAGG
ncbi:MAG TPA: DUF2970 domain-containing protein [Candidatus Competibacteraceae bacterium]|nr:DUF2970 domain-containing protein [Candidatus Competibacteraceae bacterium]